MANDGELKFGTKIDTKGFDDGVDDIKKKGKQATGSFDDGLASNEKSLLSLKSVAKVVGAYIGVDLFKDALTRGVQFNAQVEQYTATFETFTGSVDKANEVVQYLVDLGAKTPFQFNQLADATQLMMSYGFSAKEATGYLQMLGDASGGNAEKLNSITTGFARMKSTGKVTLEYLNLLLENGFNPLQQVAKNTGKSMKELYEDISDGELSFSEIEKAMKQMTSEGGQYFGLMQKQSETLNGKLSTLADTIDMKLGEATQFINDQLKEYLPGLINFIENIDIEAIANGFKTATPYIIGLTTALTTYKLAMIATEIPTKAMAIAQGLLNTAMSLSPIGLVVSALAGLAVAFIYLWNTSESFREFWINLWNTVYSYISNFVNSIINFFTVTIPESFNQFVTYVSGFVASIQNFFVNLWNSIVSFFMNTIPSWINTAIQFFDNLPYYIGYMVGYIIAQFAQWGMDLYNFVTKTIPQFINNVIKWFSQLPSKIWAWLSNTFNNVTKWGSQMIGKAKSVASTFINNVINYVKQLPSKIWSWLSSSASKVTKWGSDLASKGAKSAKKLFDAVVNGIKGLPSKMLSIGSDLVKGLWNGINDMVGWIGNKIKSFGKGVLDGIKDFFGIASPSKIMAKLVGKFLPMGIAVGFEDEMPKTIKDIDKSLDLANRSISADLSNMTVGLGRNIAQPYYRGDTVTTTNNNQVINFYQKAESPDEISRRLRIDARLGLTG